MKNHWLLRFLLLALLGGALGGAITYAWWVAAEHYNIAPGPFTECTFFTGFALMLIGLLSLTSAGGASKPTPATLEDKKGPLRIVTDTKAMAQNASRKKSGIPWPFQLCVSLLVASLVLLITAAVSLFSAM